MFFFRSEWAEAWAIDVVVDGLDLEATQGSCVAKEARVVATRSLPVLVTAGLATALNPFGALELVPEPAQLLVPELVQDLIPEPVLMVEARSPSQVPRRSGRCATRSRHS